MRKENGIIRILAAVKWHLLIIMSLVSGALPAAADQMVARLSLIHI